MKRTACAIVLVLGLLAPLLGLGGCADDCSTATSMCEECEQVVENCDRFDRLSAEDCRAAIETYEASCPGA